ncbi:hypothetical protein CEXT_249781 [Caerostris extrusa]|uniref:Uncharacterized protein n=1 Tax=Caerostris extrusa TaxID=172846 RepID=A0AAV4T9X9_CAEEX|nr:hypothetical protein CEXT_249781 [Caerostris extrusa]
MSAATTRRQSQLSPPLEKPNVSMIFLHYNTERSESWGEEQPFLPSHHLASWCERQQRVGSNRRVIRNRCFNRDREAPFRPARITAPEAGKWRLWGRNDHSAKFG